MWNLVPPSWGWRGFHGDVWLRSCGESICAYICGKWEAVWSTQWNISPDILILRWQRAPAKALQALRLNSSLKTGYKIPFNVAVCQGDRTRPLCNLTDSQWPVFPLSQPRLLEDHSLPRAQPCQKRSTDVAVARLGSMACCLWSLEKLFVVETCGFRSADNQEWLKTHLHSKCALKCVRRAGLWLVEEKCTQFVESVDCYDSRIGIFICFVVLRFTIFYLSHLTCVTYVSWQSLLLFRCRPFSATDATSLLFEAMTTGHGLGDPREIPSSLSHSSWETHLPA